MRIYVCICRSGGILVLVVCGLFLHTVLFYEDVGLSCGGWYFCFRGGNGCMCFGVTCADVVYGSYGFVKLWGVAFVVQCRDMFSPIPLFLFEYSAMVVPS